MPRMIDLLRVSALPSNLMHAASKGALKVPAGEMMEILVHLATKNQIFGQQARMTLASWDEAGSKQVAADPKTTKEVLDYLISPQNLRPALLPVLLENPSVKDGALVELAGSSSKEVLEVMLNSPRVKRSPRILEALKRSPHLVGHKVAHLEEKPAPLHPQPDLPAGELAADPVAAEVILEAEEPAVSHPPPESDDGIEKEVETYLTEHASELAAEGDKPFAAIGGVFDEIISAASDPSVPDSGPEPQPAAADHAAAAVVAKKTSPAKKPQPGADDKRGSVLQKIAQLDIKGRIQLAMKGTKEERSILIRDGTKLVALAVLESPKITDGEVERYANQKNVLEAVLRAIPMKRRFAKLYPVVRNLVSNPRTPMDISLGLMKHLLVQDLKNLSTNKEVSDTVRKLALKGFKQKMETSKK
jgi:hypothetical protein